MSTVTVTMPAWVNINSHGPAALREMEPKRLAGVLSYYSFRLTESYVQVGEADISIRLLDDEAMTKDAVTALQAQKQKVIAEAQKQVTHLDEQINSLLAIAYEPQEAA